MTTATVDQVSNTSTDDLVDRDGVAVVLGVAAKTVSTYIRLYAGTDTPTPAPVRTVAGRHHLYSAKAWVAWNEARARKLGRPSEPCPLASQHGQTPCPECGRRRTSRPQPEGRQP